MRTLAAVAALATAMAAGRAMPAGAQVRPKRVVAVPEPLLVIPHSNLVFGTVLPGIPAVVRALSERGALFEVRGPAGASVRIEFRLPDVMVNDHGDRLPLQFAADDGFADVEPGSTSSGQVFNPSLPLIGSLSADGHFWVRLGGTAVPGRPQPGGHYRATIVMTVYDLGS